MGMAILFNDPRIEAEDLSGGRVYGDLHPMCIRVPEGFHSGEILDAPTARGCDEGLVDAE